MIVCDLSFHESQRLVSDLLSVSAVERQQQLLDWLQERQRASIPEIMSQFSVSPATARRDLDSLAEQGRIQRVRGGALAVRRAPPEAPVTLRIGEQTDEKMRIAAAAVAEIGESDTIFLGSGTTVEHVAHALRGHRNLTVITNSLLVLNALAGAPGVTLVCLGGTLRASEHSFIGPITQQALSELRSLHVVMGIRAIDVEAGLTNAYLEESLIDRAILAIGTRVILVADHTKCGRVSTVFVAPLSAVDVLVTDTGTPPEFCAAIGAQGLNVVAV